MGKFYMAVLFICLLFGFLAPANAMETVPHPWELKDGDRVVFLGNSLFENELKHGYIELALTSRWPALDITFRNLGWSGDTVFGEARGTFTTPPDAYGHMMNQLKDAKPSVVFLAYGAVEAFEGEDGLKRFVKGLNQLLDVVDDLEARAVLLSPVPHFPASANAELSSLQNENLKLYTAALSETAIQRNIQFIDLYNPLQEIGQTVELTNNGIHLNETGYYFLATHIEKGLGLSSREWRVKVDISTSRTETRGAVIWDLAGDTDSGNLEFKIQDAFLPFPLPLSQAELPATRELIITGLPEGNYTLTVDDDHIITAPASGWSDGVKIADGSSFMQAGILRDRILSKNELFFHQYRPQNRTYLLGFRSHEQGQNAVELDLFDTFIEGHESGIIGLRMPESNIYRLTAD